MTAPYASITTKRVPGGLVASALTDAGTIFLAHYIGVSPGTLGEDGEISIPAYDEHRFETEVRRAGLFTESDVEALEEAEL